MTLYVARNDTLRRGEATVRRHDDAFMGQVKQLKRKFTHIFHRVGLLCRAVMRWSLDIIFNFIEDKVRVIDNHVILVEVLCKYFSAEFAENGHLLADV